ncbi:O-antigen ligase family protein [Hyphomicrobium facile]|uniref:O-antigen ligase like membrane protein n=1 Tax=Hyphomicrobium facile TaxID=51670 RepID=A0A1I7NDX6_9HYPH|nr:O-antigen ligase family protein [Hyphomicrobium facile]SFV32746.1 O-antigen ligase like membrane protein [Hyphomicrobium facile]
MIAASLLLGGGTRAGFLSDSILQLASIPLLLLASTRILGLERTKETNAILAFCVAIVLVPLLQLVPLPPAIWSHLPERANVAAAFEVAGNKGQWAPITAYPTGTWLSLAALMPPLAVFLGTVSLSNIDRRQLSYLVLSIGLLSACLGLIQVAQGPNSPLRFFEYTNPSEAVGFFANRNHFAALLYCLTVLASALIIDAGFNSRKRLFEPAALLPLIAGFVVLVILIAAQLVARSRAGLGLTMAALLLAWPLASFDPHRGTGLRSGKVFAAAVVVSMIFALQFALLRILERFGSDTLDDARLPFARNTFEAARAFMPFGSGMGTFVDVYGMFERPADVFAAYANHAHNDILEAALEAGLPGLLMMLLFGAWIVWRCFELWRRPTAKAFATDVLWERAALFVVVLLSAHALVDYALRTTAIAVVFAFSCGLLVRPFAGVNASEQAPDVHGDPIDRARFERRYPEKGPSSAGEPWGADINWPDEWRSDPFQHKPGKK